ncbi:MAG: hypothetical protein ABEK50_00410 [bacterium]
MKKRTKTKYVHAGGFVAEVDVEVIDDETGWSPYLSVEDANKLDEVREALQEGDTDSAAEFGKIYEMKLVS